MKTTDPELQKAWDRALLHCWFEFPRARVSKLAYHFERDNNIPRMTMLDGNLPLIRLPRPWAARHDVRHWITNFLPKLAKALLNTEPDDVLRRGKILDTLAKSRMDVVKVAEVTPVDYERVQLRRHTRQDLSSTQIHHKAIRHLYTSKALGSQWGACK